MGSQGPHTLGLHHPGQPVPLRRDAVQLPLQLPHRRLQQRCAAGMAGDRTPLAAGWPAGGLGNGVGQREGRQRPLRR